MEKEGKVLIEVSNLSKKFCKDLKTSLRYGVQDLFSNIIGNKENRVLRDKEFWALQDINFELRRGECLGLIGHNGAGKSTLLKILNGLINPDEGTVTMRGRVGALIELGAGFNPILTGRENIYNNGAVLGFTKQEIENKVEDIIDFSEIREFIDMPVQNYSSGMKVRLGFAVAAQMEPDILIIDEVLAVGDLGFVLKCFKKIDTILPKTAVVFVSHSMPMISRLCSKILLIDKGVSNFIGTNVSKGIDLYYSRFSDDDGGVVFDDGSLSLLNIEILNSKTLQSIESIDWFDDLLLKFKFQIKSEIKEFLLRVIFYDIEKRPIAIIEKNVQVNVDQHRIFEFYVKHKKLQMSKGIYTIDISLFKNKHSPIYRQNNVINFSIKHEEDVWPPFLLSAEYESIEK